MMIIFRNVCVFARRILRHEKKNIVVERESQKYECLLKVIHFNVTMIYKNILSTTKTYIRRCPGSDDRAYTI